MLLAAAGVIILLLVLIDILQTTFFLSGPGLVTGRISIWIWNKMLLLHRKFNSHRLLEIGGGLITLSIFVFWGLLYWMSLVLIFASSKYSVLHSKTGEAADFISKAYYVGFSITTLGVGDYEAGSDFWQILTVIIAAMGFFLLTLFISYLFSLLSSVIEKRKLASFIHTIGSTPSKFLLQLKDKNGFSNLSDFLLTVIPLIQLVMLHHLSYPAIHFFHSKRKYTAFAPAIAMLDEALSILYSDNSKEYSKLIGPAKSSIENLLAILAKSFIKYEDKVPEIPSESVFREAGIDLNREEALKYFNSISDRRSRLLSLVKRDGWEWSDVYS